MSHSVTYHAFKTNDLDKSDFQAKKEAAILEAKHKKVMQY